MRLSCNSLLTSTAAYLFLFLCWLTVVLADQPDQERHRPDNHNPSTDHLTCRPYGDCEPCPSEALHEPFCQPFGNRRLMHCINETLLLPTLHPPGNKPRPISTSILDHDRSQPHREGEISAWESCGRIVDQERADFYEFVGCNLLFAVIAVLIVLWRTKRMHALQARQLAARIGRIPGSNVVRRVIS
ncbi:hypothetical protein PM082_006210 [Marasmius tenuissimus]|nr:hypothetical protein PM082_006210 [Marasmius tenuissimus]